MPIQNPEEYDNHANLPEVENSGGLPTLPNGQSIPQYTIVDQTSLDGNKIVDLADPEYGMDAVNLRTLHRTINALELGLTEAQALELIEAQNGAHPRGRGVALRTVYEGTLAQLQALGNTIAGATVYPGAGTNDLESCGVLLLSHDANGITLLPESGVYYLGQSGQYQRAIDFRAGDSYEPGLTFWIDAIDARYEVLDRGAEVAGGFNLRIRLIPRPGEVSGEGVLHSRVTGPDSRAVRLEYSDRFVETNGSLDLSSEVGSAIDAVPGLVSDLANATTQMAVQQGAINSQQSAITAISASLNEARIAFVDGAADVLNGGLSTATLLTTVRAKLAVYQIGHNFAQQSIKMAFYRVTPDNSGEDYSGFWLECQTGMQCLDANNAVVNVPLAGTYILVISKH
jgi:hypothetical protein